MACKDNAEIGYVKSITIFNHSDLNMEAYEKGEIKLKRKYGKFKRQVVSFEPNQKLPKELVEINFFIPSGLCDKNKKFFKEQLNNKK